METSDAQIEHYVLVNHVLIHGGLITRKINNFFNYPPVRNSMYIVTVVTVMVHQVSVTDKHM